MTTARATSVRYRAPMWAQTDVFLTAEVIRAFARSANYSEHCLAGCMLAGFSTNFDLAGRITALSVRTDQRTVAGKHYPTKAELNMLYFATHQMKRPRGWKEASHLGRYWRAALVVVFNYGVDIGPLEPNR